MTLGIGEIEIQLQDKDGELVTHVLKPSLRAAKIISRQKGGYMEAAQSIMRMEFDAYVHIINVGLGLTERGAEGLDERVYKTGITDLAAPLVKYVRILANGGKPPKEEGTDDGEAPLDQA